MSSAQSPFRPAPYPGSDRSPDQEPVTETVAPVEPPAVPLVQSRGHDATRYAQSIVANWPVLVPLALFAIAAMIVPTMTNLATTDDWAYSRAVEILYEDGKLVMFPVVAATSIGQVLWGGLFALTFGMSLGVMRLSTVVMVGIGAIALYAILRQLGVSRSRSSFGIALYLFNPLSFVLSFTFMTDPHFTSWMLIAVALYLRGLRQDRVTPWMVIAASVCAGYAFWIRQQGALIPVSVVLYLLVARQLWFNWRSLRLVLQVTLAPALMLLAYYVWRLYWVDDEPTTQEGFLDRAIDEGWSGTWFLVRHIPFFDAMYLGLFLLPLTLAVLPGFRRPVQLFFASVWGYWTFLAGLGLFLVGFFQLTFQGRRMLYIPQFLGSGGFGPADVPGGRLRVVEWDQVWTWLTIAAASGVVILGLLLCRRIGDALTPERTAAGLIGMVAIWQMIGMIPPSYQYIHRGGSLDRYLLPLIPLTIALGLWAIRDTALFQPAAWLGVVLFGVVSVIGTRDYLVYLDAVWEMAEDANAAGVPNDRLDAGSGWDGYYLHTDMIDLGITKSVSPPGSPWWVYFYAKQTDSSYLVTTNPRWRRGDVVIEKREYDQWLEDDPVYIYLVRQWDEPWPPE